MGRDGEVVAIMPPSHINLVSKGPGEECGEWWACEPITNEDSFGA